MQSWHSHTFPSRYHGDEDALSKVLPKLSHMDLTGCVSNKSPAMQAHGGYCDVFVGSAASEHVRHRCTIPTGVGEVKVAIKRLRVRLGKDKKFAKSLAREMGIWSRLIHPNILPLLGYFLENEYPSLISEWIENGTVRDFVKNNPECDIVHLALGIAKGLKFIHDQDVVHSDMKADNVLISQSGEPLICDFGISRMLSSSQTFFVSTTHDGAVKGSARWMAIELHIPGEDVDPKHSKETDVWAYGMTLHEMISKEVPYSHIKLDLHVLLAVMKGELPDQQTLVDLSFPLSHLVRVCASCWKRNPTDRFTMAQITARLTFLEWRPPLIESQGAVTSYKTEQANFRWLSVDEQEDHRPDGMSLSPLARDTFPVMLQDLWRRNGIKPDARMITIGNRQIDMHQLHTEVLLLGGVVNVRRYNLWNDIAMRMGWTPTSVKEAGQTQEQIAEQFKVVYEQLLEPFEVEYMTTATKQRLSSQAPQDAGRQGGPSHPGAGSDGWGRLHEQLSTQIRVHGEVSSMHPLPRPYSKVLLKSEPTEPVRRVSGPVPSMRTRRRRRQVVPQPRLLATSTSGLVLSPRPVRAAFFPTTSWFTRHPERDNLAHSEITLRSGFASETIPSKRVKPDWEGVSGAQQPSRQVEDEGLEASEQTAHAYSSAMRILEIDNPSVFPWDSKEPLLQPPKAVVPDFDILDVAGSSSMTNMASTPSPGAVDRNYSLFAHLQQEDGKAYPADLTPTPLTSQGSEYEASSKSNYPSTRASAGSRAKTVRMSTSPPELWIWNSSRSSRADIWSIPT